jgi:hypothetical protein
VQNLVAPEERRIRCPGCGRVIDASDLRPGDRFKCTKCKKLMTFGPHLLQPDYAAHWRTLRVVLLMACIAATIWCVTVGWDFGMRTGHWGLGFGGALVVWLLAAGCIGLAAGTTQNNGVMVGVTGMMSGVALLFLDRLGRHVGYDVAAWRQFRFFDWWAPGLIAMGAVVLVGALAVQGRTRSL